MLHDGFKWLDQVAAKAVKTASDQGDLSDEFRALADLKHPYIVQVCGFTLGSPPNRFDKSWIVILELCDRDLEDLLDKKADPSQQTKPGCTALTMAAEEGSFGLRF